MNAARRAALDAGAPTYDAGKSCIRGHAPIRYTVTRVCIECGRERAKRYQRAHVAEGNARSALYRARHPDRRRETERKYRNSHTVKHAHTQAARKAGKLKAVPKWADRNALRAFYRACPAGNQVDHIIPLKHERVCGLHVIDNLQYLPADCNAFKRNHYVIDGEDINLITVLTPWREDANLGLAYNESMERAPPGSWVSFKDHDAMFTTGQWGYQVKEAIACMPTAGAFVGMTNRIAAPWQRCGDEKSNDLAYHRAFGAQRKKVRTLLDITDTKGWGGVFFVLSRDAWERVGGFAHGLGCVDHSIHFRLRDAGYRIWLIEGLYLYHWRHFGEPDPTSQFPKAENCPCRGPETAPTERVRLPG